MLYPFSALLARMKYITRWSLMHSTRAESLSEHTCDTALLAHLLCLIAKHYTGTPCRPEVVAVAALYQRLNKVNASWLRLKLEGLDPDAKYQVSCDLTPSSSFDTELAKRYGYDTEGNQVKTYEAYGDELMRAGIPVDRQELNKKGGDFASLLYTIKKVD